MKISGTRQFAKPKVTAGFKAAATIKGSASRTKNRPVFAHWCFFTPVTRITKKYNLLGGSGIFLGPSPIHMMAHSNPIEPAYPCASDLRLPSQFTVYRMSRLIPGLPKTP